MNAEALLRRYDQVVDSPDAVKRLRAFILDLAVRGKLVDQDPRDGTAADLLNKVSQARPAHASSGSPTYTLANVALFETPPGWCWSSVGQIASKTGSGSTPRGGRSAYKASGIPFLRSQNIHNEGLRLDDVAYIDRGTHEKMVGTAVQEGDLLLNITGGSIGRCCRVPAGIVEANVSQHVAIIRPAVTELGYFLHKLFLSPYFQNFVLTEQTGAGRGGLPKNRMDRIPIAIPPLAEQRRIVAKVDELMALCDRLEKAGTDREGTRAKLTRATLARLNNHNPETFRDDARFTLDVLPTLTARADQISQLRRTILALAVRGKLTHQDPRDGKAPEFGRAVQDDGRAPFNIPPTWRWACLRTLGELKGGGTPSKARSEFWEGTIPWVSPKDMKVDYITDSQMHITEAAIEGSAVTLIPDSAILFVVRGMILAHTFPVAATRVAVTINQDMKALVLNNRQMHEFVLRALKGLAPEILARVKRSSHGTCRLEGPDYQDLFIPIPPLAEQQRIVERIDELMLLCDQLETALACAEDKRGLLLSALITESLQSHASVKNDDDANAQPAGRLARSDHRLAS